MIQKETELLVVDNSGAKVVACIGIPGGTRKSSAKVGDIIVVSVKVATPNSSVKKGDVIKAVIVRTKSNIKRKDGTCIKFSDNAVVLINNSREPIGTRIVGTIAREVRHRGFMRIVSLAPEVL